MGRAELQTRRYPAEVPFTPSIAPAAAASPAVAVLRLVASAFRSREEASALLLAELRFQRVHALLKGFLAFLLLLFADCLARRLHGFLPT